MKVLIPKQSATALHEDGLEKFLEKYLEGELVVGLLSCQQRGSWALQCLKIEEIDKLK